MVVLLIIIVVVLFYLALGSILFSKAIRQITLKRNHFVCFEKRGGTSLAMVKNGKVGKTIEFGNGKKIKLTEKLYKVREGWDGIHLYRYVVLQEGRRKKIQEPPSSNRPLS